MAIKDIQIKVGQVWRNIAGEHVQVVEQHTTLTHPACWELRGMTGWGGPIFCDDNGQHCGNFYAYNLDTLVSDVENRDQTHASLQGAPTSGAKKPFPAPTPDAAKTNTGSVGDINSDAKGSGARFNSGKPPYELVPLQLMADYYHMIDGIPGIENLPSAPIAALGYLGKFQYRDERDDDDSTNLMNAMIELGDGWKECAEVFAYGAKKYKAFNWCKGMAWSVPIACAARHLQAIIDGEVNDPESGKSHRGHAYCNIVMLLVFLETYTEGDDRPPVGMFSGIKES